VRERRENECRGSGNGAWGIHLRGYRCDWVGKRIKQKGGFGDIVITHLIRELATIWFGEKKQEKEFAV